MAQKLVKILDITHDNGESVKLQQILPYVLNPQEFIFEGARPLELAALSIEHNWVFSVVGDIDVSRYNPAQASVLPNFSKIAIHGKFIGSKYIKHLPLATYELDLSKCGKDFFDSDIELPEIIFVLNCAYAIQSLDVLFNRIPETVTTVIVEAKLIKPAVLMEDAEKLAIAKEFIRLYPKVIVRDPSNKYELHQVLQDIDNQKTAVVEIKNEPIKEKETVILSKKIVGQHIDANDILELCKIDEDIQQHNLKEDDLKRQIRFVLNSSDIEKTQMIRNDGATVNCVNASEWPIIRENVIGAILIKKAGEKLIKKHNNETAETKPSPTIETKNTDTTDKNLEPIDIQKYISKSTYKQAKKSSGNTNFLTAIDSINRDIINDINYQGGVKIIKNGTLTVSQTVKKESGCALVQSCDSVTNNDRKRLVWTFGDGPNGPVIVCMGFFEDHIGTDIQTDEYKTCLKVASKRHSFTKEELSRYQNVKDLLNTSRDDKSPPVKAFLNKMIHSK